MSNNPLEERLDSLEDEVLDLTVDLRKSEVANEKLQEKIDDLENLLTQKEKDLSTINDEWQKKLENARDLYKGKEAEIERCYVRIKDMEIDQTRALAGLRTIALENYDYFKTPVWVDLLNWARERLVETLKSSAERRKK